MFLEISLGTLFEKSDDSEGRSKDTFITSIFDCFLLREA